ncbi:MAG: PP2C family protein-serine/threonine phosphatase [Aeromicrobium sp.]
MSPPQAQRVTILPEVPGAPAAEADLRTLLAEVLARLDVDVVTVLRFDPASDHLVTMVTVSEHRVNSGQHRVPLGRGLAGKVAASRLPIALDDVADDDLLNPALYALGVRSVLAVPLMRGDRLLGVLKVATRRARRFGSDDLSRAAEFAEVVLRALDVYDVADERSAAAALQRSLVPHQLPVLDGLQLAGRYVPGDGGASGDWYDVFPLPGGRVGIVMGDVAGHGLGASVVMGRLRSALRAYALEHDDPAEVLRRLDSKIYHFEPGAMATALYAVTEPPFDEVRVCSAGHLLPVMAAPGMATQQLQFPVGIPLGVDPSFERTTASFELPAESVLVLFTDGLIERRATTNTRGSEVFASVDSALAELGGAIQLGAAAESIGSQVLDAILTIEPPSDDVALLVVRLVAS